MLVWEIMKRKLRFLSLCLHTYALLMQGSFTGPRIFWSGSSLRTEATGYGLVNNISSLFFIICVHGGGRNYGGPCESRMLMLPYSNPHEGFLCSSLLLYLLELVYSARWACLFSNLLQFTGYCFHRFSLPSLFSQTWIRSSKDWGYSLHFFHISTIYGC